MSFAINPSLNHIDIREPYIIEMYRSTKEILLPGARFRGHPCEAYICISKVDKEVKAYVALLEMGMKSVFVYTSDFSADNSADYPKVIAEANEFANSIGFSMEKVNLDFSPAMREVIIKGFRIMRAPQKKPQLRSVSGNPHLGPTAEPQLPPAVKKTIVAAVQKESLPAELANVQSELTAARAVVERLRREKLAFEQSASGEIAALKIAAEKATGLKRLGEEKLAKAIEAVNKEKSEAASRKDDALTATLKAELDSALRKAELVEKSFNDRTTALQERIETLENRNILLDQQLLTEMNSATEKILQLTAEKESISARLYSAEIAAADKIATLSLFETSWREGQQREEDLCRDLDLMKEQQDLLEAELVTCRERETTEAGLISRIAALEKEIAASSVEIERLGNATLDRAAVQAELKSLAEAKNDVEAEYIRLANESMLKETEMLDTLYAADAEILRLSREIEIRAQTAEREKAALENELKQSLLSVSIREIAVAAATPAAVTTLETPSPAVEKVSPLQVTPTEPRTEVSPAEPEADIAAPSILAGEPNLHTDSAADDTTDAPVSGEPAITDGLKNEFGNFCGSSGHATTEFTIDPSISTIEYSDPGEIIAVLHSNNTVQAVPDGCKMQRCTGYVIATKKEGEYRAYVAWYLTESKKVIFCTPEQQPADSWQCTQILQDAITYFEIVGFIMELEDLGDTIKSYNKVLRKIPALSRK